MLTVSFRTLRFSSPSPSSRRRSPRTPKPACTPGNDQAHRLPAQAADRLPLPARGCPLLPAHGRGGRVQGRLPVGRERPGHAGLAGRERHHEGRRRDRHPAGRLQRRGDDGQDGSARRRPGDLVRRRDHEREAGRVHRARSEGGRHRGGEGRGPAAVPRGNYALIGGDPGQTGSTKMQEGYREVLSPLVKRGDVKIVLDQYTPKWKTEPAQAHAENALTAQRQQGERVPRLVRRHVAGRAAGGARRGARPGHRSPSPARTWSSRRRRPSSRGRCSAPCGPRPTRWPYAAAEVAVALARCETPKTDAVIDNGAGNDPLGQDAHHAGHGEGHAGVRVRAPLLAQGGRRVPERPAEEADLPMSEIPRGVIEAVPADAAPLLKAAGIVKRFPGVLALDAPGPRDHARRDRRAAGTERRRQVHDHADPGRRSPVRLLRRADHAGGRAVPGDEREGRPRARRGAGAAGGERRPRAVAWPRTCRWATSRCAAGSWTRRRGWHGRGARWRPSASTWMHASPWARWIWPRSS